jgi:hypothetical protein
MSDTPNFVLSSGDKDATPAYLFCSRRDPAVRAITRHPNGDNLPPDAAPDGWRFESMIALGVREALPVPISPEPVLRGLLADGLFIWRERSNPKGTSQ